METFRQATYWFMGGLMVATVLFSFVAIILGGMDLRSLIRRLKEAEVDHTDDGRVSDSEADVGTTV